MCPPFGESLTPEVVFWVDFRGIGFVASSFLTARSNSGVRSLSFLALEDTMSDLFQFKFSGGPIDGRANAAPAFEALGYAAASWARFEQHIDAILIHINKKKYSKKLYNKDFPVAFTGKIRLLKRWFNQHPALAQHTKQIREITSRQKVLRLDRNRFLHSILEHYDPATQEVTLRRITFEGNDKFRIEKFISPLALIVKFAEVTNLANRCLKTVSNAIFTESVVSQLEKSQPPPPLKKGRRRRS